MTLETDKTILDAAFTVLAARPTATLAEIAKAAGVGRATLHRYFPGRDDLIEAMALMAADELEAAVNTAVADAASYTEALRLCLEAMIPLADRQYFLANEPLERFPAVAAIHVRQNQELANAIDAAKSEGGFDPNIPTAWIVAAYDTVTYTAWALVRAQEATPRQAAAFAWRLLQSGLEKGPK